MRVLKSLGTRHSAGFALVEALVCMALLAVALFPLLKLQAQALQSGANGQPSGVAARLAENLAERALRNRAAARAGAYDLALGASATTAECDGASTCTPTELAQADLADWQAEITASLPQSRSLVRRTGTPASTLEIWLIWRRAASAKVSGSGTSATCASDLGLNAAEPEQCLLVALPL